MNNRLLATAFLLASIVAPSGFAATIDGSLGSTSTGNVDINLEKTDDVQISGLDTIDFGTYGALNSGNLSQGDNYCVYINAAGSYRITPTSVNGAFQLDGAVFGDSIPYSLSITGRFLFLPITVNATYNTASMAYTGSNSRTCNGATNGGVNVSVTEANIRAASTDTYSDTLILLVNPI